MKVRLPHLEDLLLYDTMFFLFVIVRSYLLWRAQLSFFVFFSCFIVVFIVVLGLASVILGLLATPLFQLCVGLLTILLCLMKNGLYVPISKKKKKQVFILFIVLLEASYSLFS
jgi:hypothetical protein